MSIRRFSTVGRVLDAEGGHRVLPVKMDAHFLRLERNFKLFITYEGLPRSCACLVGRFCSASFELVGV